MNSTDTKPAALDIAECGLVCHSDLPDAAKTAIPEQDTENVVLLMVADQASTDKSDVEVWYMYRSYPGSNWQFLLKTASENFTTPGKFHPSLRQKAEQMGEQALGVSEAKPSDAASADTSEAAVQSPEVAIQAREEVVVALRELRHRLIDAGNYPLADSDDPRGHIDRKLISLGKALNADVELLKEYISND